MSKIIMKYAYTLYDEEKKIKLSPSDDGYELEFETIGNFKPLYDNVLVEKDPEKEETMGGIYLPDTAKDKPSTGVVKAVGTGLYNEMTGVLKPLTVKVGDRILFAKYAGTEIEYGDKTVFIIKEKDILSIIE